MIRRIHVTITLRGVRPEQAEVARRAHEVFKPHCPVYRSIHRAISITTELALAGPEPPPGALHG